MDRDAWADFLEANEAGPLTLTLAQRNLIADADQHIDWLESRKRFNEEQIRKMGLMLSGASSALRSYEYGNSAPDLAKEIADAIDALIAPKS